MNFTEFLSAGPEKVFRALVDLRTRAYAAGLLETVRLPVPVFCIGNLTVGGTGKTPGVVWLASYLREKGRRPAVLTRGYGRKSKDGLAVVEGLHDPRQVGDEPLFLARRRRSGAKRSSGY
jgi:tetraacyldisaccharide 4'-kinase